MLLLASVLHKGQASVLLVHEVDRRVGGALVVVGKLDLPVD